MLLMMALYFTFGCLLSLLPLFTYFIISGISWRPGLSAFFFMMDMPYAVRAFDIIFWRLAARNGAGTSRDTRRNTSLEYLFPFMLTFLLAENLNIYFCLIVFLFLTMVN